VHILGVRVINQGADHVVGGCQSVAPHVHHLQVGLLADFQGREERPLPDALKYALNDLHQRVYADAIA
jgi:hypothetical protein